MIAVIIIGILVLILLIKMSGGKPEEEDSISIDSEPIISDEELTHLKAYCCGGKEIERGAIEAVKGNVTYEIKGFNIKGEEIKLNPDKISWQCSCQVVKFEHETGIINTISCANKGDYKRNIWVKYKNGVTFSWKIQFK